MTEFPDSKLMEIS